MPAVQLPAQSTETALLVKQSEAEERSSGSKRRLVLGLAASSACVLLVGLHFTHQRQGAAALAPPSPRSISLAARGDPAELPLKTGVQNMGVKTAEEGFLDKAACALKFSKYSDLPDALVMYAANESAFDAKQYVNLVGKPVPNSPVYFNDFSFRPDGTSVMADADLKAGQCSRTHGDTTYYTLVVGPMTTTGGKDFTDVSLRWHPEGLKKGAHQVTGTFTAPIDLTTGDVLPIPPLHLHHVHVEQSIPPPTDPSKLFAQGPDQYVQVAGDSGKHGCTPSGPDACYIQDLTTLGQHYRAMQVPLAIDTLIQDTRPTGSEAITWWAKFVFAVTEDSSLEPTGIFGFNTMNPDPSFLDWMVNPKLQEERPLSGYFQGTLIPTDKETYVVSTWSMPTDGTVLGFDEHTLQTVHSHSLMFDSQLILAAPVEEVLAALDGLGSRIPDMSGKGSTENNLNCLWSPEGGQSNSGLHRHVASAIGSERIVCRFNNSGSMDNIDGLYYDRLPLGSCTTREFKTGENYTSVAFMKAQMDDHYWYYGDGPIGPDHNMHIIISMNIKLKKDPNNIRTMWQAISHQGCQVGDTIATAHVDPMFQGQTNEKLNPPVKPP